MQIVFFNLRTANSDRQSYNRNKQCENLFQGCSEQNDDLVHDSASDLIDCLFEVVKLCGELSLATETLPMFLQSMEEPESVESRKLTDFLHPTVKLLC